MRIAVSKPLNCLVAALFSAFMCLGAALPAQANTPGQDAQDAVDCFWLMLKDPSAHAIQCNPKANGIELPKGFPGSGTEAPSSSVPPPPCCPCTDNALTGGVEIADASLTDSPVALWNAFELMLACCPCQAPG